MSFINLIMEQKVILITFLLAVVPLVIGVTFLIVTSIRKRKAEQAELAQKREARRRAMAAVARRDAAAQREADEEEATSRAAQLASTTEPRRAGRRPKSAAGSAAPDEDDADAQSSAEAEEEDETPETPESGEEESISTEMQSLLSDVFGDDESAARYDALLKGVTEVDIDSLAALSNGIAARLRAKE